MPRSLPLLALLVLIAALAVGGSGVPRAVAAPPAAEHGCDADGAADHGDHGPAERGTMHGHGGMLCFCPSGACDLSATPMHPVEPVEHGAATPGTRAEPVTATVARPPPLPPPRG